MNGEEKTREQRFTESDIKEISFVRLAKELLDASIESSEVLRAKPYSEESLPKAKMTLGYLNALIKAFQTKVHYYRIMNLGEKIKGVEKNSKNL